MADADNVDAPYIHEDKLKSFSNTDYLISNFSKEILRGTCLLFENVCMYVQSICFCKTKILLLFYIYASLVPLFPPLTPRCMYARLNVCMYVCLHVYSRKLLQLKMCSCLRL